MRLAEAQPLPYNVEAEEAVLGSLMLDNDAVPLVAFLSYRDFYREKHQWIFRMILSLHKRGEPIDYVTICDELARYQHKAVGKGKKQEEQNYLQAIGGYAAISELALRVPTALHVEHYARIVERHALLRRLIGASEKIHRLAYEKGDEDISPLIAEAERILLSATQRVSWQEPIDHRAALVAAMEDYLLMSGEDGESRAGIPTCSRDLNRIIGGFKPGLLYVDAARPGMGKSSKMVAHMRRAIEDGYNVLCYSLEMSQRMLMNRLVAAEAGVDLQVITDGPIPDRVIAKMTEAIERLNALPGTIIVDDAYGLNPDEIRAKTLRRVARGEVVDMVWIDHLQEVGNGGTGNQFSTLPEMVGQKIKAFRNLGKELEIPMGVLCQLNRKCEERKDKRPMVSDLKDSGGIEESADVIMFTYRDEVYNSTTERPGIAETNVAKQRNGPKGVVEQRFIAETGEWHDLETFQVDSEEPLPMNEVPW